MKKSFLRIISVLLVIIFAFSCSSLAADKEIGNGYEDDPWLVQWQQKVKAYVRDDVLYFYGEGNIDEVYVRYSLKMLRIFSAADIGEGVTGICNGLFQNDKDIEWVSISKSIKSIGKSCFGGCTNLKDVYYQGSEEEWQEISIAEGNDALLAATLHFNGEGEKKQFTEHKKYNVSVADYYKQTSPEIRKNGKALKVGDTIKFGDEIDFTHTNYSARIDLYATSTDTEKLERVENFGSPKIIIGGTDKDPSILEWKVRKINLQEGVVELYGSVRSSGIKIKSTGTILC